MDAPANGRHGPTGFRPWEISALVNRRVVETHASEAAFLWTQRDRAVRAPHFQLKHLHRFDARLTAHLEGLLIAGDVGRRIARAALGQADAGAVFVVAWLAVRSRDAEGLRLAASLGLADPAFERALVAAMAWCEPDTLRGQADVLWKASDPAFRRLALRTLTAHRRDADDRVAADAQADDSSLRACALRHIGEAKRNRLLPLLRRADSDADPACRFWAGRSLALLGEADGAAIALGAAAAAPVPWTWACDGAMRLGEPTWAREQVRRWAGSAATLRKAVIAAGALGDPAVVPWLLEQMEDPSLARVAGEAFGTITGADIDLLGMKQDAPPDAPEDGDPQDADLYWPDARALRAWWKERRSGLAAGRRWLLGAPVAEEGVLAALRHGYQRQRRAAALELARLHPRAVLFPTSARAAWQRSRLAA